MKNINVQKTDLTYESCDFSNRKKCPVHWILENVFFNCDEEYRLKIEADVIARGDGKLWKKYMDAISENIMLDKDRITYFHADAEPYNSEKVLMNKNDANWAHYASEFEKQDIYDLIDIVKTVEEAIAVLIAAPWVKAAVESAPTAYLDTNASRKGIITRQSYMKDLRERLMGYFKNEFSQNRSKVLTKGIIDHYESLTTL